MDASVAELLSRLETARLALVDRLAILDQCPPEEREQEAFRVLAAYLRLNRQNKAGKAALRLDRKRQSDARAHPAQLDAGAVL